MTTVTILHDTTHIPGSTACDRSIAEHDAIRADGQHLDEHAVTDASESLRRSARAKERDFLDHHGGLAERALYRAASLFDRAA